MQTAATASTSKPWLTALQAPDHARLSLICFPYAGASAAAFGSWRRRLPEAVEAYAVQLPGRANRLSEAAYDSMSGLVLDLCVALAPQLARRTVLLGHSMGALVAFELARELRRQDQRAPVALVLSGCRAPHLVPRAQMHELPDLELLERLRRMGGTPSEVLEDPELVSLALPALRADLRLAETYRPTPESPLDTPIAALAGTRDDYATLPEVQAWRRHTRSDFSLDAVHGGHFFIHTQGEQFLELLAGRLEEWSW